MSRRKNRIRKPPSRPKPADLSDVGTDETPTGLSRVVGGASTQGGASQFTNEMSVKDFAALRQKPNLLQNLNWKDWVTIASIVGGTVGIVWAAFLIQFGLSDVEEKVDGISSTVSEIKGVVERNEIRLDNIEGSVSDLRREVSSTKDTVNELRVETAQKQDNKDDE